MPLTPKQITQIESWLPLLDIPQPDAGPEVWTLSTIVASVVRQIHTRFKRTGVTVSRDAITEYVIERVKTVTSCPVPPGTVLH